MINPKLNVPQSKFINLPHKFKAFVAGFGSGKTFVGCADLCKHFWEFPNVNAGYFAPTYAQIRDIFFPTIDEVVFDWGLRADTKESNKEVHIYEGRRYRGTVICRSMDKPNTIVGFKIGKALVDEIDVLAEEKATNAWRKIIARMRMKVDGLQNGIDITTTPEGFKFVYKQFVKALVGRPELAKLYGLIQASTYDNEANLPDGYIDSLFQTYTEQLIQAYLNGQFVNLLSGTVYHKYDRELNRTREIWDGKEDVHIGMDFNVGKMAAIVHVFRKDNPHAVDEIVKAYDTPDMIRIIKERYSRYENGDYKKICNVHIYPDSSGDSRKSVNASETDLALLRAAGFSVHSLNANPPVKDRVNSMNAAFCNAKGERRYYVNDLKCTEYSECLMQQIWKNGEPDKDGGQDHTNDAGGYFIYQKLPVIKPVFKTNIGMSF